MNKQQSKDPPSKPRNSPQSPQTVSKFWNFIAAAENQTAELILYGDISASSWWGDEITPKQFDSDLQAIGDVSEITVRINSGGGDVFAAVAIFTRLKSHKAKVTVIIDGWAASAATIIAMAGDTVKIPAAASFMIHDPAMGVMGYYGEEEFAKFAEELTVTKNCIVNAYAMKTGKDKEEIAALMAAETWYTGSEAVEAGFCDEVLFEERAESVVITDFSRYRNVPKSLLNSRTPGGGLPYTAISQNRKGVENMEIKTVDELKAAYPELTAKIADTATATERKRIQDIEGIALAGFEEVISKAKFEAPATAAEVAINILAEQKKQGAAHLSGVAEDVKDSGADGIITVTHEGANDKENPFDAAIDRVLPVAK